MEPGGGQSGVKLTNAARSPGVRSPGAVSQESSFLCCKEPVVVSHGSDVLMLQEAGVDFPHTSCSIGKLG